MGTCSEKRKSVPELFGSSVFNDDVMQERLPKDVYKSLRKTIDEGKDLDLTVANAVASAMKDWAVEKGATHYTHWFQPVSYTHLTMPTIRLVGWGGGGGS